MTNERIETLRATMLKGRKDYQDFMAGIRRPMTDEEKLEHQPEPPLFCDVWIDKNNPKLVKSKTLSDGEHKYFILELKTREEALEMKRVVAEMERTNREFCQGYLEEIKKRDNGSNK